MSRKLSSFTGYRDRMVFSDKIPLAAPDGAPRQIFFICKNSNLDQQLHRFWETEELPEDMNNSRNFVWRTLQEAYHTKYTGCYIVRLAQHEGLGQPVRVWEQARWWFHQLEQCFQKQPDLHQIYSAFKQEYEEFGHMNQFMKMQAAQRNVTTFHIMWFWRVPAVQHALTLFLMAHDVWIMDCLWVIHF